MNSYRVISEGDGEHSTTTAAMSQPDDQKTAVSNVHDLVSVRDNCAWRKPRGRPLTSWLNQVDRSCDEIGWEGGLREIPEVAVLGWAGLRAPGVCPHSLNPID